MLVYLAFTKASIAACILGSAIPLFLYARQSAKLNRTSRLEPILVVLTWVIAGFGYAIWASDPAMDLIDRQIQTMTGEVKVGWYSSEYGDYFYYTMNGMDFKVSRHASEAFMPPGQFKFYYTPRAKLLLGVEAMPP